GGKFSAPVFWFVGSGSQRLSRWFGKPEAGRRVRRMHLDCFRGHRRNRRAAGGRTAGDGAAWCLPGLRRDRTPIPSVFWGFGRGLGDGRGRRFRLPLVFGSGCRVGVVGVIFFVVFGLFGLDSFGFRFAAVLGRLGHLGFPLLRRLRRPRRFRLVLGFGLRGG